MAAAAPRAFIILPGSRGIAPAICMSLTPNNSTIRKITSAGIVSTFAGTAGVYGSADGTGAAAQFYIPFGVAVDGAGNVYVADTEIHDSQNYFCARRDDLGWLTGAVGHVNGTGSAAQFYYPYGVAATSTGTLYVADTSNREIRKLLRRGSHHAGRFRDDRRWRSRQRQRHRTYSCVSTNPKAWR